MSAEDKPPTSYRAMMVRQEGDARSHLGEPVITIDPRHIDARTRHQGTMALATLSTISAWVSKKKTYKHPSNFESNTNTLTGILDIWEFNYKAKAMSLDGKNLELYSKIASFIAVGSGDESGVLTSNLLNEGAKNLGGKTAKTK
jgi:hypothetical protein